MTIKYLNPKRIIKFIKEQIVVSIVIILSVFLLSSASMSLFGYEIENTTEFVVESGDGLSTIVRNLNTSDLIKGNFWFKTAVLLVGKEKEIQTGSYIFQKGDNTYNILSRLISGNSESNDIVFFIPEGFTIFDIDRKLSDSGLAANGEFIKLAMNFDNRGSDYYFMPTDFVSLEGYLFPDTYRISLQDKNIFTEKLIEKMLDNFESKAASAIYDSVILGAKSFLGKTRKPRDVVIMASILEKELRSNIDMSLAAGILWKRLDNDVPLQVDATIIYGVCAQRVRSGTGCDYAKIGVINYIDINSEYNTYLNLGLPDGPISNPGIDAINAAISSISSDYWFYLSVREDGRTIFSRTLREHNIARDKYL